MIKLGSLSEMFARSAHFASQRGNMLKQEGVVKVPEDGMAIVDRVNIVQGSIKERLQVICLFASGDVVDDLI
jgi:hypothetical protein